jgi:hypothetical protein
MKSIFIIIFLLISGCYSSLVNKGKVSNPPSVSMVHVPDFEDMDRNQDGNLSKKEFNEMSSYLESSSYSVEGPILVMCVISVSTLIMCVGSAWLKCNKAE